MRRRSARLRATVAEARAERFRVLYDENHRAILAFALRRTVTAADAADVLADTMLVAWRRIDEVPWADDEVRPWLFGVAHKILANYRRGALRRDRLGTRLGAAIMASTPDRGASVADDLWVRAALETLSELDREVLTMCLWEDLTPAEIAVALGIPAGTVRTRLHRARARVRVELVVTAGERIADDGQARADAQVSAPHHEEVT